MIISLNWLKKYIDISNVSIDELTELIGTRLVEVEEAIDLAPKYKDALIVKVEKCEPVEGSDHLSLCQINTSSNDLVQVVCGANNVYAGMLAVWLPPESVVPETYGTAEPFVLGARKLCGHMSNGMLASIRELGFGDDHDGIVEIDPKDAKAGDKLADAFGLDDILLDIENKSLTHRPDCFGVIGFAREVAGILGKKFVEPDMLATQQDLASQTRPGDGLSSQASALASRHLSSQIGDGLQNQDFAGSLKIKIIDPNLCPRYQAVIMDLPAEPSSKYLKRMQTNIARSGMRSIDPVVDSTNDLMLLTGQPLHAFDYDKFVKVGGKDTPEIIVRAAKPGEKLELLDGKTVKMAEGDIVITSNNVPVALAGAMGGANTAIDKNTKRIIVESATFNLYNLRGTQFRHGIFSEAITRFTKGQPPALTDPVIRKFVAMTEKHYGLKAISPIFDAYPKKIENQPVEVGLEDINNLLGSNFSFEQAETTLRNVGFDVSCDCGKPDKCDCKKVKVTAPYWRTDIHIKEDVIEEIGRLTGFDNIPAVLPQRDFAMPAPDALGDLKSKIRNILSGAGANEVLTYSFIHGDLLKKAGQDPANSYQLINSLSPNLEYLRQSLTPSLLEKTYMNLKAGFNKFALFEINRVHQKKWGMDDENVPREKDKAALVLAEANGVGDAFYEAKLYVENLFRAFGIEAKYMPLLEDNASDIPFEIKRRAKIEEAITGQCLGVIGEYKPSVLKAFKLPVHVAGFELLLNEIAKFEKGASGCKPISKYPSVERDISFKVKENVAFADLESAVSEALDGLNLKIVPLDIYQKAGEPTKTITLRITFSSNDKTLDRQDIIKIIDKISERAKSTVNAEVV